MDGMGGSLFLGYADISDLDVTKMNILSIGTVFILKKFLIGFLIIF